MCNFELTVEALEPYIKGNVIIDSKRNVKPIFTTLKQPPYYLRDAKVLNISVDDTLPAHVIRITTE